MSEFLDAAARLGERLCAEAIHDGRKCTWFGSSMEPVGGEWIQTRRTFGGDAYAGTSGVALFLAQLHRFIPSDVTRSTALAALEQALDRAERDATLPAGALYTGAFGIGFAAAECGAILDAPEVTERGLALVRATATGGDATAFDIVSGAAGRIGALLRLHRRFGAEWLLGAAIAAGRQLVATAERSAYGASWGFGTSKYLAGNLTGYSHGAAGVAVALLLLDAAHPDDSFRATAAEAMRYERNCFSPQVQNWPDFRRTGKENPNEGFAYGYAWCHGAPGIGMSRLVAYRLTKRDDVLQEARIALRSTRNSFAAPSPPAASFGLCHGVAGNAELFLLSHEILGDAEDLALAETLARRGIEQFGGDDGRWPSGLDQAGEAPGLMLGMAGIGYFFLRMHGRAGVPSILIAGC